MKKIQQNFEIDRDLVSFQTFMLLLRILSFDSLPHSLLFNFTPNMTELQKLLSH